MKNLWRNNFKPNNIIGPKDIVNQQGQYLRELTNGKVFVEVKNYFNNNFNNDENCESVQGLLGELKESQFVYECYVAAAAAANYKYRIMFITYGLNQFPVKIYLSEAIAAELNISTEFQCNDRNEFENMLGKILNSEVIENIINRLLSL